MALTYTESWESGNGKLGKEAEDIYSIIVTGTAADKADDVLTVMIYAAAQFSLQSALGNILTTISRNRIAPFTWLIEARYTSPTWDRQSNDASFSFSTGGGTQHITHSRRTVAKYAPTGQTAPDHQGTIGVSGSSIEGVDIDIPAFNFRTTFYLPAPLMTQAYNDSLYLLTSRVNSDNVTINVDGLVRTFNPGELKFLFAEGQKRRGFADWELTLNWSAIPNETNIAVGPIKVPRKNGWDYLWVDYQQSTNANGLVQIPKAVYIEQVYDYQPLMPLLPPTGFGQYNPQVWATPPAVPGPGVGS